jgi:DNA polymerase-3 subunit gamma/tau
MAYKALYRTYRPSTFDEVAGQQHIVKTIKNALATRKIAHAYLFAGPRGTGKTTMAKLLAKALNCDEGIGLQCNECKNCQAIIEGTHPDVLEIDAASNNGVDEIRELIDKVKYGTILGRYKVYIIDEVHMMTPGAFNALLKTLEEPPEHVIFILATTEPHKILPTILSRCQRYDFSKVSEKDIKERLKTVLEKEGITFNEEAVDLIISLADGGMRDALSILDQVLAYTGDHLNSDDVLDMFALESVEEKQALLTSVINGDVADVLSRLSDYTTRGTDIRRLTDDLLSILKDVLIYKTSRRVDLLEHVKEEQLVNFSKQFDEETVVSMIDALMNTLKDYKNVTNISSLFQICLLKMVSIYRIPEKEEVVKVAPTPKVAPVIQPQKVTQPAPIQTVGPVEDQINLFDEPAEEKPEPVVLSEDVIVLKGCERDADFLVDDDTMLKVMVTSKKEIKNNLLENWKNLRKLAAHPSLGRAASMLLDGHPLVASTKVVVVEFQLAKNVEKMNQKSLQKDLQNVITSVFGSKMFVYSVDRNESLKLQKKYMDLLQVGKLPKANTITLEFEGE